MTLALLGAICPSGAFFVGPGRQPGLRLALCGPVASDAQVRGPGFGRAGAVGAGQPRAPLGLGECIEPGHVRVRVGVGIGGKDPAPDFHAILEQAQVSAAARLR